MIESLFGILLNLLGQPWLAPALTFIIGLAFPQPQVFANLWAFVMGARKKADEIEALIDAMDAVLKANGVIPANAPKLSAEQVKAVLEGKVDVAKVAAERKVQMANL